MRRGSRSVDVERPVARVRRVSGPEDDAQRHEVRECEENPDRQGHENRLPRAPPAEDQDDRHDRQEREDEAVDEAEGRSLGDAAVDLVADAVRPPARYRRRGADHGNHEDGEQTQRPENALAPISARLDLPWVRAHELGA